jgi:hypothetical protein
VSTWTAGTTPQRRATLVRRAQLLAAGSALVIAGIAAHEGWQT